MIPAASSPPGQDAIRVRGSTPIILLVPLAACGFIWAGLSAALWGAVIRGEWQGEDLPAVATALVWIVVVIMWAMLAAGIWALILRLFAGRRDLAMTDTELAEVRRDRVLQRLTVSETHEVRFLPGQRTTWTGGSDPDPRPRLTGSRLQSSLRIAGGGATFSLTPRDWQILAPRLLDWTCQRPDLIDDPHTAALLSELDAIQRQGSGVIPAAAVSEMAAASPQRKRQWWPWVWLAGIGYLVSLPLLILDRVTVPAEVGVQALLGLLLSLAVIGGIVGLCFHTCWSYLALVWLAVRRRDPWAPFRRRPGGDFAPLISGRTGSLLRVHDDQGSVVGLVLRWLLLTIIGLASMYFPWLLLQLSLILADLQDSMKQLTTST